MEDQIYITIAKVLHGEATEAERRELQAWLDADKANADIFKEMKESWEQADSLFTAPQFNAAPAWEKVSARIHPAVIEDHRKGGRTIAFPAWTKYASAIAAMLIIAFTVWNPFSTEQVRIVAEAGNRQVELPDHSVVTLRKGSSLRYPKTFDAAERAVALEGEAFFEVTRNEQQPFVIDAQSVSVKVLGTSFNVLCDEGSADVSVTTGKVQVTAQSDKGKMVVLTPGDAAHYDKSGLSQHAATGFEAFWKGGELSFKDKPLNQVVEALAKATKTVIELHRDMTAAQKEQLVSATFRNQSLEDMLTELCLITNCRWEKVKATYVIRPR